MARQKRQLRPSLQERLYRCLSWVATVLVVACVLSIPFWLPRETPTVQPDGDASSTQQPAAESTASVGGGDAGSTVVADEGNKEFTQYEESGRTVLAGEDGIAAEHEAGVVLAKIPEGMPLDEFNAKLAGLGFLASRSVGEKDVSLGWVELEVADNTSVLDAVVQLEASGLVDGAQPNYVYYLAESASENPLQPGQINGDFPPTVTAETGVSYDTNNYHEFVNDPDADDQGVLLTVDLAEAYRYLHEKGYVSETGKDTPANAILTWNRSDSSKRPVIAVLDTGVDVGHEDLGGENGNIVDYYNAYENKKNATYVDDHGTHVAGIASAITNNKVGITGVSFNAGIMAVNVFQYTNGKLFADSKDIATGYQYVLDHADEFNVRVVNLSLGSTSETADAEDKLFLEGIEKAYRKNILTVIASGNDANVKNGAYTDFPADFTPNAVSVIDCAISGVQAGGGGISRLILTLSRDSYSNFNKPGTIAKQVSALGSFVKSTIPNNRYDSKNGTSMAAPCVAGLAALALQVNPGLTVEELKSLLYSTAKDIAEAPSNGYDDPVTPGFDLYTGFGGVNADRLVRAADTGAYLSVNKGAGETDVPVLCKGVQGASTVAFKVPAVTTGISWESSNTSVATVDNGLVTAKGAGQAIISASYGEGETATTLYTIVTVYDAKAASASSVAYKQKATVSVDSNAALNASLNVWQWTSSDPSAVSVDRWSGTVTGNKVNASATLTAELLSNPSVKLSKTVTVSPATLTDAMVSLSPITYTYDGKAKTPTVTVKDGAATLGNGTDYTFSYKNNVNAGAATVTVTGKGNYKGTVSKTFKINAASVSDAVVSGVTDRTYNGKAQTQSPTVKVDGRTLKAGTDYALSYSNNVNAGTATVTVTGKGNYAGTKNVTFKINAAPAQQQQQQPAFAPAAVSGHVSYRTHVQNIGWQGWVSDGAMSGTSGRSLRLEGINVNADFEGVSGGIEYRTHIQNIGWESEWKRNGAMSGTSGRSLRLEAIQIQLTGDAAAKFDVYYRVHCQNFGWMGWAKNGAQAGSAGYAYRLEGIEIRLVPKGGSAPGSTSAAFRSKTGGVQSGVPDSESKVLYRTHVQNDGWQNWMRDGEMAGTQGRSLRLEGINIKLGGAVSGGIEYRTHIQNIGWQEFKSNGEMSGTSGRSLRLEAIEIRLTGEAADKYDVYYRVHAQNIGWMGWAKNGERAGTAGYAYRLEGINVQLVPKGGSAPGSTSNAFRQR